MEQSFSTSKVTVEYHDPHGLYDLLAPGLAARLPLRHLHWQSHSGPLRSIDTLHVELVAAGTNPAAAPPTGADAEGFQVAPAAAAGPGSTDPIVTTLPAAKERRHQIPGLRRTPYLKMLLVRCDDNDGYKAHTRGEIRDWVKAHAAAAGKKAPGGGVAENHDAFDWMVVHVVLPNTAAYAQPRTSRGGVEADNGTSAKSTTSRWGKSPSTVLERLRADFNGGGGGGGGGGGVDRVAQIRLALADVPYERLPRAPPAAAAGPGGETAGEAAAAWAALVDQLKTRILASFDVRVAQYEDDIREKDLQRRLPGWNFCTFFILKEGLARGFESVGLVEDALVGYDELSVGLDTVVQEQAGGAGGGGGGAPHASSFLASTDDLKDWVLRAVDDGEEDAPEDLQGGLPDKAQDPPISATKKPYRELILANNVSVFDFRCYLFARQVALLLRLGNATREAGVGTGAGAGAGAGAAPADGGENLAVLAEIGRRTLAFIPAVSQVMREDLLHALAAAGADPVPVAVVDTVVASFAFSVAQQILAQTATKALPIPLQGDTADEPSTANPPRASSLQVRGGAAPAAARAGPPPSPGVFPGPGQPKGPTAEAEGARFLKLGLEELAARRADLYMLSRNILEDLGKKRGWTSGWADAPFLGGAGMGEEEMEEVSLDDRDSSAATPTAPELALAGAHPLLRAALQAAPAFDRLYEALTDKALRHYTVAGHAHAVHAALADLAVLKHRQRDFAAAAALLHEATPFFGETGWARLELALLALYARCLRATGRADAVVRPLVKLLTKAAAGERARRRRQRRGAAAPVQPADQHDLAGYVPALLDAAAAGAEVRVPLASWLGDVAVVGPPAYADGRDSVAVTLRLDSYLAEDLPVDTVQARMVQTGRAGGPPREIWLAARAATALRPGRNKVELWSNSIIPGVYEIDQLKITAGQLLLVHDRHATAPAAPDDDTILQEPHVVLYQRARSLDVQLATARDLQLHKNNLLELTLHTGWNDVRHCEVRVRAATGGLRLLVSEARVVGSDTDADPDLLQQPVEGGVLRFGAVGPDAAVTVAFPFSIEQDVLDLCVRVDVSYTTAHGVFAFAAAPAVSTALALGVNVQDVFKHDALFCRFTVSTASASPLRVYASAIADSDLFAARSAGLPADRPAVAFAKQPVSLLYRVERRPGSRVDGTTTPTLYLKLRYSVLLDEIEAQLRASLADAFRAAGPRLAPFSRVAAACVVRRARAALAPLDLERAALLGELATDFLAGADWAKSFPGLGHSDTNNDTHDGDTAAQLAAFLAAWRDRHPRLPLPPPPADAPATRTILIPVDIPRVTIVHTADIQLQGAPASLIPYVPARQAGAADKRLVRMPVFSVNQLLPATLHLKWTRLWDTGAPAADGGPDDLEFSFEVTAPADTWLVGGRRKGHFVIPAPSGGGGGAGEDADGDTDGDAGAVGWASTPACEAAIPLMLIPLREGHLPYPSVEIREVATGEGDAAAGGTVHPHPHHHETDYRNVGETVHVVADRSRVTLSLDASGPGGGPLVLKSERTAVAGRVVV